MSLMVIPPVSCYKNGYSIESFSAPAGALLIFPICFRVHVGWARE